MEKARSDSPAKEGVSYFSKQEVEQIFATGASFVKKDPARNYQVSAGHRTDPGTPEIHLKDTDIFYVIDGSASIVTGGKIVEEKTIATDEIRGTSITGGETRQLSKGDLIVIPHGTPHWMNKVEGEFKYLVIKVR